MFPVDPKLLVGSSQSELVLLYNKNSIVRRISSSVDVKDPELKTRDSLKLGQVLRGYVTNCSNQGIFVR